MSNDVVGDRVDLWISVADPGDELGQGCEPGIAGECLGHGRHDVGHGRTDLTVLQRPHQQTLCLVC